MELALITPPVGMNLHVVQGIRGQGTVSDLFVGILPFVAVSGGRAPAPECRSGTANGSVRSATTAQMAMSATVTRSISSNVAKSPGFWVTKGRIP